MRKLQDTELFKSYIKNNDLSKTISSRTDQGLGDIGPKNIETELMVLKNTSKNSYMPFISDAVAYYENFNGRIRLFNYGAASAGKVPSFIPFLAWRVRNRVNDGLDKGPSGMTPAVLMNMYRIGHWSVDESEYLGLNAKTDLYACLETGVIMYKMLVEGRSKDIFSNETILKHLTKIYSGLFSKAAVGAVNSHYGENSFQSDVSRFIIAKFFLLYVLDKQPSEMIDDIAYASIEHFSTLASLKNFEETTDIDYSSLSKFLKTFGNTFFNKEISLMAFDNKWIQMYGEGMLLAIEYAPFLLHFLFAAYHGAPLGGSLKLYIRIKDLTNDGLPKLYNAIISELK